MLIHVLPTAAMVGSLLGSLRVSRRGLLIRLFLSVESAQLASIC